MTQSTHQPIVIPCATKEDWLRRRLEGLGGSDAPALMGVDPYKTELQLYAERTEGWTQAESVEMRLGNFLEPGNRASYAFENKRQVLTPQEFYKCAGAYAVLLRHPEKPWMQATPDGIIVGVNGGPGILQLKNTGAFTNEDWSDAPPLRVQVQVQHEMHVAGMSWGAVGAIIGGNKRKDFDLAVHPAFVETLIQRELAFLDRVRRHLPPEPCAKDAELLSSRAPIEGTAVEIDPSLMRRYAEMQAEESACSEGVKAVKAEMMAALGDAEVGTIEGVPVVTWKMQKAAVMGKIGDTERRTLRILKAGKL